MSDFFMSNQDKNELQSAAQIRNDIQKKDQEDIEAFKQKKQERLENWNRYGVDVPDEYYNVFNQIISKAPTPEEAQEEAYKIGSAVKYSRMMNMPLEEAYKNVDSFNEAMFTDLQGQKSRYEALSDMFTLGTNNVKLGRLGQELMQAHGRNDTELANALMAEIDALNQQNVLMQDNAPRTWVMEALEAGAQSLPFTGVVAGAGIIGNFIAPAVGTGASFAASSYLASGQEYIDMIANGASPQTARLVATVSGGVQGLIEADLGISKSIVKGTARIIGKEAAEKAAKKSVEEIGRKVFKRFHFGAGKKVLINYLENRGKDILGEGTEEFLQEITSIVGQEVAAGLDGYDIPDDDIKSIVKQTTEAFRGGVLGALSMGFIPAGINAAADVKEYKLIKDTAEIFESEEMFKEVAKDSPVFEGMSDEQKAQTIHDVWQNAQNRKEEAANIEAQKKAEGRDAAEGAEEAPVENEDGTTEANPVARDETGRLYTSDDVSMDDNGNVTGGTFVIGDKTKSENNRYGYIKYSQDAEGNITIDTFKMTEGRDKLRAEAFDEFARQHPDVRIDWNAIGSDMQEQKQALIDANPSGAKNGLSYYSTSELDNVAARKQVAEEVRKNIHNVKRNADGSYTRTELSNKQVAAAVTLIESAARRMGMGLNEYVSKTFGSQIFGSREEFASASLAQGEDVNKKAGGMFQGVAQNNWREVGQQVKAVIYAGENADFSTWAHEMAHVFQNQLDGDLKNEAEAAFNVVGGDWINSTYTFSDGRTLSSAEAFAYGFQDWLETGKAESEQMKNIFQKFAEFIADAYNRLKNHLNFTPEIVDVFNKLLDGDDTIMSKALKAAQEQDNEYRANLKRQAEEKQASKEAEKEQAKKQAEAEREEAREGTDFTEAAPTAEELLNGIEEAENETEKTDNAIDNALENTNLTDEQKAEISKVLKDESSTVVEKAEATTEAAESAYDDEAPIDLFQTDAGQQLLSQLAGEPSIRRMAESELKTEILDNLKKAQHYDESFKGYSPDAKARKIRLMTGWEKGINNTWQYETDDSNNTIKPDVIKKLRNNPEELIRESTNSWKNVSDYMDAPDLFTVFPYLAKVRVTFISDPNGFRSLITPTGIVINTAFVKEPNGEKGLVGSFAHELQHVIQALEYAQKNILTGENIKDLYSDMLKAIQTAAQTGKVDNASIKKGIDKLMLDKGEVEARNVARRVLMDADLRRKKTLESTEDVKRNKLLSQEENPDFLEAVNKAQELLFQNELTMYGIHNLSEDALRHAVKMGGLANPSMAVVDTEKNSFTNFGEVSLIPYNYMLEKGEGSKGTFGADIYSPRYPSIDKRVTETGQKKIHSIFHAIEDEQYKNELEQKLVNKIENSSKQFDYAYSPLVMAYLAEKGNKDFYKYEKSEYSDEVKDLIKSLGASPNAMAEKDNKVILEAYSKHLKKDYEEQLKKLREDFEELKANPKTPEWIKNSRSRAIEKLQEDLDIANETIKDLVDEKTGLFNGNVADDFLYRVRHEIESAGKIDYSASEYAARELIENDPEFLPWAKEAYDRIEKEERIFNGFTPSGNRRYLAHTLENVSKYMRQQELQGGESFYYGLGSTRAKFTPNFKTLNQIKKARDRLVTSEEFEKIKEEYNERFDKITEALSDKYDPDVGAARFEEAFEYGKSDPIGYIEKEYGISVDDDMAQEILDFATALRVMPTEYFETKFTRPVELNEFAGAIIPSNLSQDLKDTLAEKGLMIEEYDKEAGNREEVTKAALQKFNETRRVLFQVIGEIGAQNLDDAEVQEGVSRMQNLAIAQQMEVDGKDAETIRLATGWERGAEGKWKYEIDDGTFERPVDGKKWETVDGKTIQVPKLLKEGYLYEFYKNDELYKAYPDIDRVWISFVNDIPGHARTYNYGGNYHIDINEKESPEEIRGTLIHEIQHVIQDREGFAKGGSPDDFKPVMDEADLRIYKDILEGNVHDKRTKAAVILDKINKDIDADKMLEEFKPLLKSREKNIDDWFTILRAAQSKHPDWEEYKKLSDKANKDEEELNHIGQYQLNNGKWITPEEAYWRLAGEVEARNADKRNKFTPEQRRNILLAATEDVAPEDRIILFQEVYHGSPHNFENFSTENIGTGEGAQAFGWGLYFTNQESIARFYADKLANEPKRISLIAKNEYLKSRKKSLKDVENKEKYEARIIKNINHFKKELKQAQKAGDESEIKFYEGLIDDSYKQLDDKERLSLVEAFKKDIANAEQEIKELKASMKNNRNLYTVEIPDEGYVVWDKNISEETVKAVYDGLAKMGEDIKYAPTFDTETTGEDLYGRLSRFFNSDKKASLFLKELGFIGIEYPAHSLSGYTSQDERNYVIFDEANANIKNHLLYQKVYHGSGADFDKFDTENYGFSGEGSMSFGYGTYVTDNEDIARDYADRQVSQKYQNVDDPYNVLKTNIIATIIHDTEIKGFEKALKERIEFLQKRIENSQGLYTEEQVENSKKVLDEIKNYTEEDLKKRRLYTVEIPDNGYIVWDKPVRKQTADKIKNALFHELTTNPDSAYYNYYSKTDLLQELESVFSYMEGQQLYRNVSAYLEGDEKASKFLHKIGYTGIKYPAGTIHGNGRDAYNYVIFNDDDAKIVDKLLFQTNAELMQEAQDFENWQEFMEYCETFHADEEVSPIPSDADAQWYQTYWETSHGVEVEAEKNEQEVKTKNENDSMNPIAVDALFSTFIKSYPEMIDNFLQAVAEIDAIDLDSEEWQQAENAEDAAQREQIEKLKDFIAITLSDYNWQTALRRIQGGHEIAEGLRKRLIGEMTDNFKTRDFRALYAEIMNDEQYAVAPEDSVTAMLNKKLKKYHDIVKPNDDISKWSPERRKQLAEQLANKEIAAKIRNGSLKLDDELDAYIKSLNKQIKETQDQYNELEKETKADYQRIADKERRDLLKLHEQLLLARGKLNSRNTEINRKIAKGLKITEKYSRMTQNLNANYDEIFRKYNDLRNSITINSEVQAALDRQVQVAGLREDLNAKQKEKNLTAEVKKMRIQLVKRTMRRVPFNRIDYENAKTVIAIQRMLEPNLLGGVNRFIGIDSPYLRGLISQIVTDSDYKEKIMNYLSKNTKASQAFANFKKKLEELKSIKDFDSWTAKERKAAIRYLPKENWVRDLNLKELAKEREESIDLDIGMEEVKRTVYDEKTGEPKTYKDKEGNTYNVTETAFKLKYDDELGRLVQDAVGADMFDKIVNMPFSEWTTEDLEGLAQRIDELYTEGRDLKAAKDEARKRNADSIRRRIEDAVKETGITINDDDTPEEKERKQKQIEKILGMNSDLKGTEAGKDKGFMAKITRLLHSYSDMNVLRFARMLDGQSEGENVRMLYRKEDDCYNAKQRSMNSRASTITKVMADNKITEGDLAQSIKMPSLGTEFTVDELLYFLAADKDYVEDEKKLQKGEMGIDANDDYAATSRNAVMFGNMMSDAMSQEEKEQWLKMDKDIQDALQNDTLTQEQKEQLATGQLDKKPGTSQYIAVCHAKWATVLQVANQFLEENPKFKVLMEAIEADYASQYERMNEISINEFNMPVHRVKAYVPLVRRESNGDTNENKVKEDLLGAAGVGKQWADRGMTQRRVNISPLNQKPVQTGLFRTWADSIERTEHFIAYAPYVRQLNAVYKSRDAAYTRRFIESRYGAGAIKYLDEYINEVANPNAGRIRERGAEWLHVLRGKTAPAYLGWKASAIIKQGLTSPWPYMQFVNPAEYMAAAMKFTFNPEMREAIKEKSVFMKMRRMDPVNDLIDEMADNAKTKLDRGWSNFSKLGMQGLEMIDWACVAPGWLACYEKKYNQLQNASNARYEAKMAELKERNIYAEVGTSEYLTPQQMEAEARKEMAEDIEAEAVRYADDCTRQCQPSNRVTDLAPLFKNSSEAMKAFLQFQTSLNVIWQNLRYDMPYAVKNKEFTRIAGTVIGYVCAGIFMNSVMDGIGGDDDDDDTQALRNLIYYSTTQFTDAIPIMGSEITNTMDQLITGKRGFISSGTDMTPSATKLLSVLTTAKKGNWQKAAELTAEGIGLYLGAPVSGVKEINKLLGKPLKEGDVNLARGIGDVYGIAGDILEE